MSAKRHGSWHRFRENMRHPSFSWDKFSSWIQCHFMRRLELFLVVRERSFCLTQMTSSPSTEPETANGPDLEPGSFTALRLVRMMILGGSKDTDSMLIQRFRNTPHPSIYTSQLDAALSAQSLKDGSRATASLGTHATCSQTTLREL